MGPFGSSIKVSTFVPEGVPVISELSILHAIQGPMDSPVVVVRSLVAVPGFRPAILSWLGLRRA